MGKYVATPISPERRRFLAAAAAGAAACALPGCAALEQKARGPRVVIVGGGWGGAGVARALLAQTTPFDLTLVEPNAAFMSCPLSGHYIVGHAPAENFQRSYEGLARAGVRIVRESVHEIDRARRTVRAGAREIAYDFLVLSPGVEYMEEALPGYAEARETLPVGFRAFEQAAVRRRFDAYLETGGNLVLTVPRPPYRCPPAPYERAALMAEVLGRRGVKGKVIVLDANPAPVPAPIAAPILEAYRELHRGVLEYEPNVELRGVDGVRRVLHTSIGDIPYAMANPILPMRAPALLRKAGLGERWANVRLPHFVSAADENVYVIGDAAGVPYPKSGHLAFETGAIVARHIAARVGSAAAPSSAPNAICWAYMGERRAIGIHVFGQWAGDAPKMQFKVDPTPTTAAADSAVQWGRAIWDQMFG